MNEHEFALAFVKQHVEDDEAITEAQIGDCLDNARDKGLAAGEVEDAIRLLARQHKVKVR